MRVRMRVILRQPLFDLFLVLATFYGHWRSMLYYIPRVAMDYRGEKVTRETELGQVIAAKPRREYITTVDPTSPRRSTNGRPQRHPRPRSLAENSSGSTALSSREDRQTAGRSDIRGHALSLRTLPGRQL